MWVCSCMHVWFLWIYILRWVGVDEVGFFVFFLNRLQVDYTHPPTRHLKRQWILCEWKMHLSPSLIHQGGRFFCRDALQRRGAHMPGGPAATLPTRFSIKQANNTIPTPINKWSFLNKVLYTEPLTEATHHNLMGPCTGQSYFSPSLLLPIFLYLRAEWASNGGSWNRRRRGAFRSSSCHHLAQHWLRYSTICFMIYEAINMRFPPPSPSFFPSRLFHERTHKKHKYLHMSAQHPPSFLTSSFLSFWRQVVHSSLNIQSVGSPDAWASVNVVLLLASFW